MTRGENYESFMARFAIWPEAARVRVQHAYLFAKGVHAWQKRRGGERYFEHLRGATLILVDELLQGVLVPAEVNVVAATLLHDTREDAQRVTHALLHSAFGWYTAQLVDLVTKQPGQTDAQYWATLASARNFYAWLVKAADRLHNLRDKPKPAKVVETRDVMLPLMRDYKAKARLEHEKDPLVRAIALLEAEVAEHPGT